MRRRKVRASPGPHPVSLPMIPGRSVDDDPRLRHRTTTLFAALDSTHRHGDRPMPSPTPPSGIREVPAHHRPRRALRPGEFTTSSDHATHKHPTVRAWLDKHPLFSMRTSPRPPAVGQSRRTLVPRVDRQSVAARGVLIPYPIDIASIQEYLDAHNENPRPTSGPPPPNQSSRKSPAAGSPSKKSAKTETHHHRWIEAKRQQQWTLRSVLFCSVRAGNDCPDVDTGFRQRSQQGRNPSAQRRRNRDRRGRRGQGQTNAAQSCITVGKVSCTTLPGNGVECSAPTGGFRIEDGAVVERS